MSEGVLRERRVFAGLCIALSLSVLLPILLAGRPCNDDLARSLLGSYGWVDNGRYLTNMLMRVLELGAPRATDIAPIPQFMAVIALAFAGMLLVRRFEIASVSLGILATLPLGTQPFFLQNLSYRFDSATMAAAVLCAVVAIAMRDRGWRGALGGCVALLASLNLYQPAFNVFLVLAVFELAFEIARERPVARLARLRFFQALIAALVYKLLFTGGIKDWVFDHRETIHSLDTLPVVAANASGFVRYLHDALGGRLGSIFLVITILAALPMIALGIRRMRDKSMADAMPRSIFLLLWPAFALIASVGPMLLLIDPVFAPRVFPGIGALISAALISAAYAAQRVERLRLLSYVAGVACLIVSSSTAGAYASAAAEQMKFEDRIASTMQDDLAQLKSDSHLANYVLVGSAGYAPAAQHAISQFPIIEQTMESYLTQDGFFTRSYLLRFRQPLALIDSANLAESQRRAAFDACAGHVAVTRSSYRIRTIDDVAAVDFREPGNCGK